MTASRVSTLLGALALSSCVVPWARGGLYYYPNGDVMENPELMQYCATTTKTCLSNFGKNVYATSQPVLDHEWTPLLFPEMYDQFDSAFDCGQGSKFISMDTCAQIHSPMTVYHDEGALKVADVEREYSRKWASLREAGAPAYDAFLDNSVAYWVADLTRYQEVWLDVGADIVYLRWTASSVAGDKVYYSMITHNGDAATGSTLTQYELISDTFSGLDSAVEARMVDSEQRAYFDESTDWAARADGCDTYPIGVRRSVTNIYDNIEWYKTIFASTIVDEEAQIIIDTSVDYNGNLVKYAHIKLYPAEYSTTISFFERQNEESTFGDFTVRDFELALNQVHDDNMLTPYCGIDRWFDMHYAIELNDAQSAEKVLESMMTSGLKYTVYGDSTIFLYMPEPNGHSVQVVFGEDTEMNFYTTPQDWDPDWCPMECTDEMASYSYGDVIADFNWADNDEARTSKWFGFSHGGTTMGTHNFSANILYGFLASIALFVGLMIGLCYVQSKDQSKYQPLL